MFLPITVSDKDLRSLAIACGSSDLTKEDIEEAGDTSSDINIPRQYGFDCAQKITAIGPAGRARFSVTCSEHWATCPGLAI